MILIGVINKFKLNFLIIIIFLIPLLCYSCSPEAKHDNFNQEMLLVEENELSNILGSWYVAEYLGEAVEFHGIGEKTEEQKKHEEIFTTRIKEKYIEKTIEISNEKVKAFYPAEGSRYHYSDFYELFTLYRQPYDLWEGEVLPPFFCILVRHTDFDDDLEFIVDDNGMVTLYVSGLFFKLVKAN